MRGLPIAQFSAVGAEIVEGDDETLCFSVEHVLDGIGIDALS
jgi:hypothetical protein